MTLLHFIHILAIGIWVGCIATETAIELREQGKGPINSHIAALHWHIDLFVEVPAYIVAGITGLMLFAQAPSDPLITAKAGLGILAVLLNSGSVYLIYKRHKAAQAGDGAAYDRYEGLHTKIGLGFVVLVIGLIGFGGYLFVN